MTLAYIFRSSDFDTLYVDVQYLLNYKAYNHQKKVREKSRECHNHKPQPFPDSKRLKEEEETDKSKQAQIEQMTHGKTYNESPRRINHKATKSKTNTGTTALERSAE